MLSRPGGFRQILHWMVLLVCCAVLPPGLRAEGTKQLAPNPDDIVMLLIDNDVYGNFAAYDGPESSRLYFRIENPGEVVYLGLSRNYRANGQPESSGAYNFRIRRASDGAVVHGPFTVHAFNENVSNWSDAVLGPAAITGEGYATTDERYFFDPAAAGDYFIEFENASHIGFWDITVAENGQVQSGRVYSANWAFRTPAEQNEAPECVWDREFNGILYSYTSDGFVTKIDFSNSGFQGLSFNVAFNSTGPGTSGNPQLDRMSVEGENLTENSAEHLIFLNEPDPAQFPDGVCGGATVAETFLCTEDGGYCLETSVTQPGQVEIVLDFNKNGVFDAGLDIRLLEIFDDPDNLSTCISWDGLKGDGSTPLSGESVNLLVQYTQGVQHWALFDGEFLKNGFCVEPVRPICINDQSNLLYWDDRNITDDPGTGTPKDGRLGCDCNTGSCRTWNYFDPNIEDCRFINDDITLGYGDKSTLNTWWFARNAFTTLVNIPFPTGVEIEGETEICENDATILRVVTGADEIVSITWEGPDGLISEGGAADAEITVSESGVYTVTVLDAYGCSVVATHTLNVIVCPVDVELDKSADFLNPGIGQVVTFEIALTNYGPGVATGIRIEDVLPDGLTAVSAISGGGVLQTNRIVWSDLSLDEGETLVLSYRATVQLGFSHTNLAEVTRMDQLDIDSTPGNGVDTDGDGDVSDDPDDEDDGDGVVLTPQACSISASVANILCDDNGTPVDPSDDTFTFEVTVNADNAAQGWVAGDAPGSTGLYGEAYRFGPYPIAGGTVSFQIRDQFYGPSCSIPISVAPPPTCSDQCLLETAVDNILCNDNGTPSDPNDDTYTFELTVTGFNTGGGWSAGSVSAAYGARVQFGPYAIADGATTLTITDEADEGCVAEVLVQAPPTCSGTCAIDLASVEIYCDDNGTASNPGDDVYYAEIVVTGANTSDQGYTIGATAGQYDATVTVGPFPIAGGPVNLTVTDADDAACITTLTLDPPPTCSDECEIFAEVVGVVCDDNGTPSIAEDDLFTVDVIVDGFNFGAGWQSQEGTVGAYGEVTTLGPFPIAAGSISTIITDSDDPGCTVSLTVDAPPSCSETCQILGASLQQIQCDDNGTPTDPTDDVYTFVVNVIGNNLSEQGWTSNLGVAGPYETEVQFGPYAISEGGKEVVITDASDPACQTVFFVTPPEPCSDQCAIEAVAVELSCNDNGTPSHAADDVFTFQVIVTAINNAGAGWIANDGTTGNYGEAVIFGSYPISGGNRTIVITSIDDPDCRFELEVAPPEPCSNQCLIEDVELLSVVCDDNGTPDDSVDDFFTYTVIVNGLNLAESWTADDGTVGAYGVPVTSVPHPVAAGAFRVEIADANDPLCTYEIEVNPPPITIECPEDASQVEVTRNALILEGELEEDDPRFAGTDNLCWLPGDALETGDHYYDLYSLRYNSPADEPQIFTFYLFSDIPGNESLPLQLDGAGGLFLGPYYPADPCCFLQSSDVRADAEEVATLLDHPRVNPAGLFSRPYTVIARFSALMAPNEIYSLVTTTFQTSTGGHYGWLILSPTGSELEVVSGDADREAREEVRVGMDLTFFDLDFVLNNPASTDALGFPKVSSSCGVDAITFADELTDLGECADLTVRREFKVFGYGDPVAQDSCEQEITLRRPSLDDIILPPEAILYACGEQYDTLANGLPAPSAAGYPLILTQSGYTELTDAFNFNLTIAFKDNIIDIPGDFTQTFRRDWTITDVCNGDLLRYSQLIKIGGFTEPIVECPVSNHYCPIIEGNIMLFALDPFECTATVEAPLPDIINTCGEREWMVRTEVLQVVGPDTLILATFEPGTDRVISGLTPADYIFRYTVFDDEGHEVEKLCLFRVGDTQEPTAVCRTDLEVLLPGSGVQQLTAAQIDRGSYDNCEVAETVVRRVYLRDPVTCELLAEPIYSDWGPLVEFNCCDVGQEVTVELRVTDIYGIENKCWLDVEVAGSTPPMLSGLAPVSVNCSALPDDFDPGDLEDLAQVFGRPTIMSTCEADALELPPILSLEACGSGTIERRFQIVRSNGIVLENLYTQVITIEASLEYEIGFPADALTDCVDWTDPLVTRLTACDSIEITYTDAFLEPLADECYRIARTYRVINHCDWDGVSEAVVISRDENCDGEEGEEPVWILRRPDATYIDRDDDESNVIPAAGTRGADCDGGDNAAGYWRTAPSTGYWEYTQIIRVEDNSAPEIAFDLPEPFCSDDASCTAPVRYPFTVTDACVLESLQSLTVTLDLEADGTIDDDLTDAGVITGAYPNFTIEGDFPLGRHQFRVTAVDYCGNAVEATLPFSAVDCYVPDLSCPDALVDLITLESSVDLDGDGELDAAGALLNVADLVSFDPTECTGPLQLSLNEPGAMPDLSRTTLAYTCDDRYSDTVEVYIWDQAFNPYQLQPDGLTQGGRNYKTCRVALYIQDPNGVCPDCEASPVVSGTISTEQGYALPTVELEINELPTTPETMTSDGVYTIDELEPGEQYRIRPHWDAGHREGISTLDLLLLRAHILGIRPLQTPYQLIAADVNRSGDLTTLDLLELRAVILGEVDRFAHNTSWRFVDRHYVFPDFHNPWQEVFPESVLVDELSGCVSDLDFVAVKIGDVDGSLRFDIDRSDGERGSGAAVRLSITDRTVRAGETFTLPVQLLQPSAVAGMQFTLSFDPALVEAAAIIPGLLDEQAFGSRYIDRGLITASWDRPPGPSVPAEASVEAFGLMVRAKATTRLSELFRITSGVTRAEGYRQDRTIVPVALDFGANAATESLRLYQNRPNPFADQTIISFDLPRAGLAELQVTDINGRVVWRREGSFPAGYQEIEVYARELPAAGMYYYTLSAGDGVVSGKFVVVQ